MGGPESGGSRSDGSHDTESGPTPGRVSADASPGLPNAIDVVLSLGIGRRFKLHRRFYTLRAYGGASHYAACSQGGERSVFPVWNENGKPTTVVVRPGSPVIAA